MDQILKKSLEKIGIEITDEQKEQFDTYHKLLEEWNKVMNLTGITEYEEVVEKHYVDSFDCKSNGYESCRYSDRCGYRSWFSWITAENCIPTSESNITGFTE